MKKETSFETHITEINSDIFIKKKFNSKASYIEKDFFQMQNYIKNLEKTIAINKEIINDFCSKASKNVEQKLVDKLNFENKELIQQVKNLTNERDELKAKLLISDQMIEEFKKKENEISKEYETKSKQMIENECILISEHKKKCMHLEEIIDKLNKDLINKEREEILENEKSRLETTLHNANSKINELEIKLEQLSVYHETSPNIRHNLNKSIPNIPTLDLSRIVNKQGFNNISYIHKLEESIKVLTKKISEFEVNNKLLAEKNLKLHQINNNLYKVNENLTSTLNMMKEKLKNSHGRRAIDHSKSNQANHKEFNFSFTKDQLISRLKLPASNKIINEESGSAQDIDSFTNSKAIKAMGKNIDFQNKNNNNIFKNQSFDVNIDLHN